MTVFGDQAMQLIREILEGLIEPAMVTESIFVAFEHAGLTALPGSPDAVAAFVRGPLHQSLEARLGADDAQQVTDRLATILAPQLVAAPNPTQLRRRKRRSELETAEMGTSSGPVRLLVVAGTPSLVLSLRGALGAGRIAAVVGRDLSAVQQLVRELTPQVVIVDGSDSAALGADELGRVLAGNATSLIVIWGVEHPWGRTVLDELRRTGVECSPLDRREGVAPLLDYLRSRAA